MNTTFTEKLAAARTTNLGSIGSTRLKSDAAINDSLRRESITIVTGAINEITDAMNLDHEKIDRAIKGSRKSEYGRVPELITQIAKIYAWPVASLDEVKEIDEKQEEILELLKERGIIVEHDLLMDIKEAKGYHSFLDQTEFTVVDGVEPEFYELEYFLLTFAQQANLPFIDYKLERSKWNKAEDKAVAKIAAEKEAATLALAAHKEAQNA